MCLPHSPPLVSGIYQLYYYFFIEIYKLPYLYLTHFSIAEAQFVIRISGICFILQFKS